MPHKFGVRQGSVLGPILLWKFCNDMTDINLCHCAKNDVVANILNLILGKFCQ